MDDYYKKFAPQMKKVRGFYLPIWEEHLIPFLKEGPEFEGGPTYQLQKLLPALKWVKKFGTAIDVGAHCGLWSRVLAKKFEQVIAFEPVPLHRACFVQNVPELGSSVTLYSLALGDRAGVISLHTGEASSGDTYVEQGGEHQATMITLDDCKQAFQTGVDFLKIDTEGFELFILKGGETLIKQYRPCIIVEQKPRKASKYGLGDTDAAPLLESWGARQRFVMSGDYCYSWD